MRWCHDASGLVLAGRCRPIWMAALMGEPMTTRCRDSALSVPHVFWVQPRPPPRRTCQAPTACRSAVPRAVTCTPRNSGDPVLPNRSVPPHRASSRLHAQSPAASVDQWMCTIRAWPSTSARIACLCGTRKPPPTAHSQRSCRVLCSAWPWTPTSCDRRSTTHNKCRHLENGRKERRGMGQR